MVRAPTELGPDGRPLLSRSQKKGPAPAWNRPLFVFPWHPAGVAYLARFP